MSKTTITSVSGRSKLAAGAGSDQYQAAAKLGVGAMDVLKQGKLTAHFRNSSIIPSAGNPRRRSLDAAGVTREVVAELSIKSGESFERWYERLEQYIEQLDESVKYVWVDLLELATSIYKQGILQPIILNSRNVIVAGERRWTASLLAGKQTSPVIVREFSETEEVVFRLLENLQRSDLTLSEVVEGLRGVLTLAFGECGPDNENITINEIINVTGAGRTTAAYYRAFCRLPEGDSILGAILDGKYTNIKLAYSDAAERVRLLQAGATEFEGNNEEDESADEKQEAVALKESPVKTPTARISVKIRPSVRKLIDVLAGIDGITAEAATQMKELSSEWVDADDSRRSEMLKQVLDMVLTDLEAGSEEN